MGNRNARVFPDPVFATPITSLPHIIAGIAREINKNMLMRLQQNHFYDEEYSRRNAVEWGWILRSSAYLAHMTACLYGSFAFSLYLLYGDIKENTTERRRRH